MPGEAIGPVQEEVEGEPANISLLSPGGEDVGDVGLSLMEEGDGDDDSFVERRAKMQPVQSQEEMLSLLPERNAGFGMKERQASLSCRFVRDRQHGGDKWRTIGHGGSRLSHTDLLSAAGMLHQPCCSLNGPAAQKPSPEPARRSHVEKGRPRRPSSMTARLQAYAGRAVKTLDDAFLALTVPGAAWCMSILHGLPRKTCDVEFEKDLRLPIIDHETREEHSLSYMILHPKNHLRKKYPTVLIRNPYGRLVFFTNFYLIAERGFNVVCVDLRGRGESTGVFDAITDHADGLAVLDWITSQPWYSTEHGVGLLGLSYNGYALWSTFKKGPVHPAVKAIVPLNTTSRLSSINYRDGPLHLELVMRWSTYLFTLTRDTYSLLTMVGALRRGLKFLGYLGIFDHPDLAKAMRHLPVDEIAKRLTGRQLNRFSMFLSRPESDFSKARCASSALRGDLPPAMIHASWYDIFLVDSLFDWTALTERGHKDARLLITADTHLQRYFSYGEVIRSMVPYFKRYLRAQPLPLPPNQDKVQMEILHASKQLRWVSMPFFPPPAAQTAACLSPDGKLCLDVTGGMAVAPGTRRYTYKPNDPTPSIGGNGIGFLSSGGRPQWGLEKRDGDDVLVYTSEVLQEDLYVVGQPVLSLWVRCLSEGAVGADFVGRICDVFPNGRSINICDGVKRTEFDQLPRDPTGAFRVDVDIYPTAVRFAKGHRIRLHVASAGFFRWERNLRGYGFESLIPVRFEVLHGSLGTSALRLPVVRADSLRPCAEP